MDELPSILKGVDIFSLLEIQVDEDIDLEESKRNLRRLFLKKAKKFHPDKQKKDDPETQRNELEFVKIKAAFDFLQYKNNFSTLYNKALSELRSKRRRLERSKDIASKQATYLDSLLKREREAFERKSEEQRTSQPTEFGQKERQEYYDELFSEYQKESREVDPTLGQLIVAAKNLEIANGSELNCLMLSSHFPSLFDNYGLISVDLLDIIDTSVDQNIKIGKLIFRSKEHAVRALLHYRNNRSKFRIDLYALALGKDETPDSKVDELGSFEKYEESVLKRFIALSESIIKN